MISSSLSLRWFQFDHFRSVFRGPSPLNNIFFMNRTRLFVRPKTRPPQGGVHPSSDLESSQQIFFQPPGPLSLPSISCRLPTMHVPSIMWPGLSKVRCHTGDWRASKQPANSLFPALGPFPPIKLPVFPVFLHVEIEMGILKFRNVQHFFLWIHRSHLNTSN